MIDLITEARAFQDFCHNLKWKFCFIGGLAVQHWGEPRLTRDVDVSVLTGFGPEDEFISAILKNYEPRFADAAQFAAQHRVLLVQTSSGVDFDISLAALPFEEEMIRRSVSIEYLPGVDLKVCSAEDLIVLKCFANRVQDWQDVKSIVERQGSQNLIWDYILTSVAPLVELKGEPQIVERLKTLQ
jgi:predicted nucleotidyltransferase